MRGKRSAEQPDKREQHGRDKRVVHAVADHAGDERPSPFAHDRKAESQCEDRHKLGRVVLMQKREDERRQARRDEDRPSAPQVAKKCAAEDDFFN